jgi:anthranilate synthase/aminodeoxychorismate synthase-like glutamine amidotransferase
LILLLDNYDSFTYNLVDYFGQLGIATDVVRNDINPKSIDFSKYTGLVLSPGPEKPKNAGYLMQIIDAQVGKMPILGICLGHQALGQYFGSDLVKANYPMHGKLSEIKPSKSFLFEGLPSAFSIVRYHSLILKNLPKNLIPIAYTSEKELMAFEDINLQITGIQFHPEAILTEYGLEMLNNWVSFYNIV